MARWSAFVLRHRWWVVGLWLVIAVAGAVTAGTTTSRLSFDFGLPGQPAYETNREIVRTFGGGGANDPILLVSPGDSAVDATAFSASARRVSRSVDRTRIVTPQDDPTLVSQDGRVAVALLYPPVQQGQDPYAAALATFRIAAQRSAPGGTALQVTGAGLLAEGSSNGDRGALVEIALGALGALVVLVLVFGSLLAVVPLVVAAVSILGTFLFLLALTSVFDVSFVVQFLVGLIGLGVAIDYSLLIVMRWREERSAGVDNLAAVGTAMVTAGRSVVFSGVTVAVSLAALILVPLPFLRSIGLGGLLIPLLSVSVSLTLLPVLLATVGPALQWPRKRFVSPESRGWAAIARRVVRHRWPTIAGSVVVLGMLAVPVAGLALGTPQISAISTDTPEGRAATMITGAGIPLGVLRPTEVLIGAADAEGAAARLREVDGVAAVAAPLDATWRSGDERLLQVWSMTDPSSETGRSTLDKVRALGVGRVGGSPAEDADFVTAVYGDIGWVVLGVVLVTFLLLARALRSLWLPVKALMLNAFSLAAAYGVSVWIWQDGHGSTLLFHTPASGAITTWVPIAAFAFLFGLSMDYEVFILSRMREYHDNGLETRQAVVSGIANTARLVTSAALILFLAFVALSTVPTVEVKILATTLALGIAIDAVIVRGLLAPALVAVLGPANWTIPKPLARLLRITPDTVQRPNRTSR